MVFVVFLSVSSVVKSTSYSLNNILYRIDLVEVGLEDGQGFLREILEVGILQFFDFDGKFPYILLMIVNHRFHIGPVKIAA